MLQNADLFFATARERYRIKLKRDAGERPPWTDDPEFRQWRFTNVHREDDKTTTWLRDNIRHPLSVEYMANPNCETHRKIIEAVLIFRWFNRIETGRIIKDLLLTKWDTEEARRRLTGISPVVTGAYIIKAGDGVSKLDGILDCIDEALPRLPSFVGSWGSTLEEAWSDLKTLHFMGPFMAYEVVTDLRFTPILDQAKDIMTWGNLGPGAIRGMSWVQHGNPDALTGSASSQRKMLAQMAELLEMSKDPQYWPSEWPNWEMHEVEMWLCEFSKYMKSKIYGERQKRRYTYEG